MLFKELFRQKYRDALLAARANDEGMTIKALEELYYILTEQYDAQNGDTTITKIHLQVEREKINEYLKIIHTNGLKDLRIQKLFGINNEILIPLTSNELNDGIGGANVIVEDKQPAEKSIDIDGIIPKDSEFDCDKKESDTEIIEQPVEAKNAPTDNLVNENDEITISEGKEPIEKKSTYNPDSLKDFIGQQHIVRALLKEIAIAKKEGRKHLDHILLFGNPGLGKSTLMELIAKELGVRFELLDCSQFRNSQQSLKALQNFFMRIATENEPVVIALDEIHMLTPELQSSLLTLLNNRVYVSPLNINGQNERIPIAEFTFIAATTDDDKVLDTIKNRCLRLKFQLVDYTFEELKAIYKNKISARGLTATDGAIDICVPRSRGAIRYVNSIVEGLNNELYNDEGERVSTHIDEEIALKYFAEKGIDSMGLEEKDLEILKVIGESRDGTISADVLSARVGIDVKKYISEYERYLIKIGFITVSGKGRSLTEKAMSYLKGETK